MNEYLFSYGTLQQEKVQIELFGRILSGNTDVLSGYVTSVIEIMDESFLSKNEEKNQLTAVISNNKKDTIKGTVFEVTSQELAQADRYEPGNYKRSKVKLASGKKAWIYAAMNPR